MNRRRFLHTTAGILAMGAVRLPAATRSEGVGSGVVDPLVGELIRANDERVPALLARQEARSGHRWLGGVPDDFGIHTANGTAQFVVALVSASHAPGSAYLQSAALVEPLERAAAYLLKAQHEDGTIDLVSTNFHSPPDTAFVLESICAAATILRHNPWTPHRRLEEELGRFIVRAGGALVTGGIHTPNHRWVVAGALARVNALYPDQRYVDRIDQWLAETIDIDPDGQYTEKSTSVYSPVVDRALLTVADLLNRPDLRDPVRKNLEMTLYYVHPDGEVVTEASKRQDKYQRGSMGRYYYSYRALALRDGNPRFAAMARLIEQTAGTQLVVDLPAFLEEPDLRRPLPPSGPLPDDYAKVFAYSSLARIRRQAFSATILAENSTVLSLRKGLAALEAVRVASAFFGKGQFVGEKLEVNGNRYRMQQILEGPYFQPLTPEQLAAGEQVRMAPNGTLAPGSRAVRAQSNVQRLTTVVEVTENAGRLAVEISLTGTDGVPVAVELGFRPGGQLEGVDPVAGVPGAFLLSGAEGRYRLGRDQIAFGPGSAEHSWTQLRGALPKWDGQSVYLTGFTPFRLNLEIS